jgi:nucleoside triphosphate diphosphatase
MPLHPTSIPHGPHALIQILADLRDPVNGCPWDREQTFETIAPYTIEEAYEVADAIARQDLADLKSELGDLYLQVVYHSRIAEELGAFTFADVAEAIAAKMIARHPHVYGDAPERDSSAQTSAWEEMKAAERGKAGATSALDGVALALPALQRAEKIQRRAARVGFDWPDANGPRAKIDEEIGECEAALVEGDAADIAAEFGDLLFSVVNWARHSGVDPETALRSATARFEARFRNVEARADRPLSSMSLDDLEALWQHAKREA